MVVCEKLKLVQEFDDASWRRQGYLSLAYLSFLVYFKLVVVLQIVSTGLKTILALPGLIRQEIESTVVFCTFSDFWRSPKYDSMSVEATMLNEIAMELCPKLEVGAYRGIMFSSNCWSTVKRWGRNQPVA